MSDNKTEHPEESFTAEELKSQLDMLRTRVDEILFYKWDPIGFSDGNSPRDEYSMYVDEVLKMTLEGATVEKLSNHLSLLCTNTIGLIGDRAVDKAVAGLIYAIVHDEFYHPNLNVIDIE